MRNPERFPRGARVMFIGDSITCNGTFISYIQEYYRTHFPEDRVRMFNAGVSGGNVHESALRYLASDLAEHEPTHAVIMLGMNDIWRGHYMTEEHYTDVKAERARVYLDGMLQLTEALSARGIPFVLCTPTPFDDEMVCEEPAGKNLAMALTGYGYLCMGLAEKYGAPCVDFNEAMTFFNREMQKKDPAFSLIGTDRVHPTAAGHALMATVFLRAQGFTDLPEPTVDAYERGALAFAVEAKEQKRYELEQSRRRIRTGAYFFLGDAWQAPLEERLSLAKTYLNENRDKPDANPYIIKCVEEYLTEAPREEEYRVRLQALTDALYGDET